MLFDDRLVAIARVDHPVFSGVLSLDSLRAGSFVMLRRRTTDIERIRPYQSWLALNLKTVLEVSELLEILLVVCQSDLFGVMMESMANATKESLKVRVLTIPRWETEPIPVRMIWHPRRDADPAHLFLRTQLKCVVQEILSTSTKQS